ncbi:unnamed protein product [Diplocarpon coronariae]
MSAAANWPWHVTDMPDANLRVARQAGWVPRSLVQRGGGYAPSICAGRCTSPPKTDVSTPAQRSAAPETTTKPGSMLRLDLPRGTYRPTYPSPAPTALPRVFVFLASLRLCFVVSWRLFAGPRCRLAIAFLGSLFLPVSLVSTDNSRTTTLLRFHLIDRDLTAAGVGNVSEVFGSSLGVR